MDAVLDTFLTKIRNRIHGHLHHTLKNQKSVFADAGTQQLQRLMDAVLYSVDNGGKRLRPALVYASAQAVVPALDVDQWAALDDVALAIECTHSYSLVHDDLPAMDDDDLRRGKPTCHIAYDEATAILVGDGLQALAFELIASSDLSSQRRIAIVAILARAAGNYGMVGGQAVDLASENQTVDLPTLELLHRLKTGAMIRASVAAGATAVGATKAQLSALDAYANAIGLAFQVHDDVLDIQSDTETLGKPQGADLRQNKATYPSLMGLDEAISKAASLIEEAHAALAQLPHEATPLAAIADYIIERDH
ncbi:Farnesyl diphosphate synthase [BD1-7 clade bacterium]|uniref:Farnesyl diphosphate synthase n=1 Tax=BD1-7 clade bacterium TaxID=2029982 RepID=A0A5S9N873_9GAMM|nr:Farnesyl diphosphate synthase [BD1-7 clade bacterium]CAA0085531.1 Farnesyl diphosphate synthase [BD1-7 clade bacterium]